MLPLGSMVELPWCCVAEVQRRHGVLLYLRFMDDGFIVHQGELQTLLDFTARMKVLSKFFKLEFEVHRQETSFLDLWIWKGPRYERDGKLDFHVFRKPSAIGAPLSSSSAHHPSVHSAWPVSMVMRTKLLCDTKKHRAEQTQKLMSFWQGHGIVNLNFETVPKPSSSSSHSLQCRLVLPWLPCWAGAKLGGLLRSKSAALKAIFEEEVKLSVAWKLGDSHLYLRLRALHDALDDNLITDIVRR